MAVFIGTFENKVDLKGRVSVPAQFRQTLAGQSFPNQSFQGIVVFRSYRAAAIEACGLGKTVFASDYCGARDVLAPSYRIPLSMPEPTSGPTAYPFPIAGLDIDSWDPPPPVNEEVYFDGCHRYQYNTEDFFKTFTSSRGQDTGQDCAGHGLRMYFDWDQFDRMSKEAWCARVSDLLISVCRNKADILDLGGVMKRSIMRAGFVPDVTFCESS
ncbi:MAG: MraZ N-terminal domain containing protein [Proteobacteria bacterium]|nr:MraZ N-terminal domain containing protein [Pseudomonadota bacterium]